MTGHTRARSRAQESHADKAALIARGRLKEARQSFARRGWEILPQGIRGQLILKWVADHAWLAYPADPKSAVRRHCGQLAPWLKEDGLAELVATTAESNKRWSHDQSATVLEISMRESQSSGFRFLGCDDDPTYERRLKVKRAKNAARQRKFRAANSTGRKRGRPRLELSPEDRLARSNAQAAQRMRRSRALRKNPSRDKFIETGSVTEFSVTDLSHRKERGAPEAPPPPPHPIVVRLEDIPDGLILDQDGVEFKPRPPHKRRPPPRDWMDAAMEGMNRGGRT
jgi:hypothetical protein